MWVSRAWTYTRRLVLQEDNRRYVALTTFGFYRGGLLEVQIKDFYLPPSNINETVSKAASGHRLSFFNVRNQTNGLVSNLLRYRPKSYILFFVFLLMPVAYKRLFMLLNVFSHQPDHNITRNRTFMKLQNNLFSFV